MNTKIVFTVCSVNYLSKAIALGLSMLEYNFNCDFTIIIVDSKRDIKINDTRINYIWIEDLEYPDFLKSAFKYNIIELNTAIKPWATLELLKRYDKVIYLDPDICVFNSLENIFEKLDQYSFLVTPHAMSSYKGHGRPNDQDLLRFGAFNLGFYAAAPSGKDLLKWWHEKLIDNCFYEPSQGLGVDQKWIDLAPSFFNSVEILKDKGFNIAFWNLHEREISLKNDSYVVNDVEKVVFVHFSSFVEEDKKAIAGKQTRYLPGSRPDFIMLSDVYRKYLEFSQQFISASYFEYGYLKFDSGEYISPVLRRIYGGKLFDSFNDCKNPFSKNEAVYQFAKRNKLISKNPVIAGQQLFIETSKQKKAQKIISKLFRFILFILGPVKYFALMRYLGYYSSILNQDLYAKNDE